MAAAMSSAPSPTTAPRAGVGAAPQFQIRTIEVADVMDCIAQGVQDFGRAPIYGLFFGAIYAVGGLLLIWASFALNYLYLAYPLVMAFALFAPFGAAGTYEISRRLDSGEPLSWAAVLGAVWTRAGKELAWLALVSIFTLIVWLYIAVLLFAVFYGPNSPSVQSVWQLVDEALTTPRGVLFLIAGNGVGAVIALIVFSFTAFSPPLVVDRNVDFVTAMATSLRAVAASPRAMLAWAIVIGADLVISFATLFVALLVIFPVLGHVTWRLYRRAIV